MDLETLQMFQQLLNQVSISAADPDFENTAAKVSKAKKQLEAEISKVMHEGSEV